MAAEEIIALDIGSVRTGIARASAVAKLAEPLKTVATEDLAEEIRRLAADKKLSEVIVGLPRNLNGDDTAQTEWVRHFVEDLRTELPGIDFLWQDEALTTVKAASRTDKKTTDTDAEAACIILQDYLGARGLA